MPDRHLPRGLRLVGRAVRFAMYALALVLGFLDVWVPEAVIARAGVGADVWGLIIMALALAGLLTLVCQRWRIEWPVALWLAGALAVRGLFIASEVPPFDRGAAAVLSLIAALGFIARGLDLTAFAFKTGQVARRQRRGWA